MPAQYFSRAKKLLLPFLLVGLVCIFAFSPFPKTHAQTSSLTIYEDALDPSWSNWSWNSNINFANPAPVASGTKSIWWEPWAGWAGLSLHANSSIDTGPYTHFSFSLQADHNDQKFQVYLVGESDQQLSTPRSLDSYGGQPGVNIYKKYTIPLSDLNGANTKIKGIVIQDAKGMYEFPVFVDSIYLGETIASTPTPTSTPSSTPSPTPTPTPAPTPTVAPVTATGYTTQNGSIYKNGSKITLRGINWFGAETGTHVFHGLWARNWKDMVKQMKGLKFNAVRVPICPATLQGVATDSINYNLNPDLERLNSLQVLDKILTDINNQNLHILLDHHRPDCNSISELWYTDNYSEAQWISDLKLIANRYKNLPYFLGIDLKNEPHGKATWGSGNTSTDWNLAAESAGSAVLAANPNLVIFVEGVDTNSNCSSGYGNFWGENFAPVSCYPISTSSIPQNKLVFSPHIYGPDVYWQSYFSDTNFPANMSAIWDKQFGYLAQKGYTIIPGEWGGKYGTNGGSSSDVSLQDSLTRYFVARSICSSFYWDWNPNSGDTGGILQDDWQTPWPQKLQLLSNYYSSCR